MVRGTIKYAVHLFTCFLKLLQSRPQVIELFFLYYFRVTKLCICQGLRNYKDHLGRNLALSALWHIYFPKLHLLLLQLECGHLSSYLCLSSFWTYSAVTYFLCGTCHLLHCVMMIVHVFIKNTVISGAHDLSVSLFSAFLFIFISLSH